VGVGGCVCVCVCVCVSERPRMLWPLLTAVRMTGLVYCMEYLASRLDWLRDRLAALQGRSTCDTRACGPDAVADAWCGAPM
jgi:hypothetical protein